MHLKIRRPCSELVREGELLQGAEAGKGKAAKGNRFISHDIVMAALLENCFGNFRSRNCS